MGVRAARLTAILAAIAAVRLAVAAAVPLTPEEAYHWTYARHLDWGYHDHPPMIAWAIAAGRLAGGDTPFGVRLVPVLLSFGTAAVAAGLAGRLYGPAARLWTPLLLFVEPVLSLAGGAGFPDAPLLFFWTLALAGAWRAVRTGSTAAWIAAGAAMGGAMLSKYTAVFFGVSMLGFLLTSSAGRRHLRSPGPYLGALAALAVFSPVLLWNAAHDWASLRFQSVDRFEAAGAPSPLGALKFLGGQASGLLAFLAPLGAVAVRDAVRAGRTEDRFLLWSAGPLLLFFFGVAWTRSVHLMWPMPAYVGLTVLMARTAAVGAGRVAAVYRRAWAGLAGVAAVALFLAGLHAAVFLPGFAAFPGLYGWASAAARARVLRDALPPDAFYLGLGRKYACASQIAFHLNAPGEVHGKNLLGLDGLQFAYWTTPSALAGRDAVVVVQEADSASGLRAALRARFRDVREAGRLDVPVGRSPLAGPRSVGFLFLVARGYHPAGDGNLGIGR